MAENCPLCKSDRVKIKFYKKRLPFYKCRQCGFVFLNCNSNPNFENDITDFEPAYYQYFETTRADQKNHDSLLSWISKYKQTRVKDLLDIGAGSGKWVNYLSQHAIPALGIEPSVALYHHFLADNELFLNTTIHSYKHDNPGKQFDIITAFDVLEHTVDPVEFLRDIAAVMHPKSLLFISTPDIGSIHRKIAGKYWHYYNKYHFSYFSKKALTLAAKNAGLVLVNISHRPRYFHAKYLWNYFRTFIFSSKKKNSKSGGMRVISLNLFDNMYCILRKE